MAAVYPRGAARQRRVAIDGSTAVIGATEGMSALGLVGWAYAVDTGLCAGDLDGSGAVGVEDLRRLFDNWG